MRLLLLNTMMMTTLASVAQAKLHSVCAAEGRDELEVQTCTIPSFNILSWHDRLHHRLAFNDWATNGLAIRTVMPSRTPQ